MGYAAVEKKRDIPKVYSAFQLSKDVGDNRLELSRRMDEYARKSHLKIHRNMCFSEATVKEAVGVKPNPDGTMFNYATCDRGETPLSCIPPSENARTQEMFREEARKQSRRNATAA